MPTPSPFHERTAPLCRSYAWKDWAGYCAVARYDTSHEREYFAFRETAGLLDVSPLYKYEVTGQLSIKGKTQEVVVPATFTPQGNSGVFEGSFTIRRADFSIGEGSWAKFDIVANDVQIKFRITAASK